MNLNDLRMALAKGAEFIVIPDDGVPEGQIVIQPLLDPLPGETQAARIAREGQAALVLPEHFLTGHRPAAGADEKTGDTP